MLEALERANLFVVPLDDHRQWFRYHHLFADALRAQLASADPDRVAVLHQAAARWYAEHRACSPTPSTTRSPPATPSTPPTSSSSPSRSCASIATTGHSATGCGQLPEHVVRRRPLLATFVAWVRLSEGDLDGVAAWLDSARGHPGRPHDVGAAEASPDGCW